MFWKIFVENNRQGNRLQLYLKSFLFSICSIRSSSFGKNYIRRFADTNITVKVTKPIKQYQTELEDEINEKRLWKVKKFILKATDEVVEKKICTTDPGSGLFVKGEHKRYFAYRFQVTLIFACMIPKK